MEQHTPDLSLTTREAAFSIMLASIGLCCFTWQSNRAGWMFYKVRKPIHAIVFAQAFLGIILNFVTLLASLTRVDCMFVCHVHANWVGNICVTPFNVIDSHLFSRWC